MRLPRKGVLIRLAIYVPLLGYFGWQALERWRSEQAATVESAEPSVDEQLAPHKKWVTFPDGTKQEIYELTPQQAEDILGHKVEPPDADASAPTAAPDEPPGEAAPETSHDADDAD